MNLQFNVFMWWQTSIFNSHYSSFHHSEIILICLFGAQEMQIYTVIQAVHSLLYIVAKCHFFSVVTWKDIIKYLQKCEGCTHFCEILCMCIYIYLYIYTYIQLSLPVCHAFIKHSEAIRKILGLLSYYLIYFGLFKWNLFRK